METQQYVPLLIVVALHVSDNNLKVLNAARKYNNGFPLICCSDKKYLVLPLTISYKRI
jgi:hypothetical protein